MTEKEKSPRPPFLLPIDKQDTDKAWTTTTMTTSTTTSPSVRSRSLNKTGSPAPMDESHGDVDEGSDARVEIVHQPHSEMAFVVAEIPLERQVVEGTTRVSMTSAELRIKCPRPSSHLEVVVVLSCVTASAPFCSHPNRLLWQHGKSEKGVISATFKGEGNEVKCGFQSLAINRVSHQHDIALSLSERKAINVDPFRNGFLHSSRKSDSHNVRLCFQVFLRASEGGTLRALRPVVSDVIRDIESPSGVRASISSLSTWIFKASGNEMVTLSCPLQPASRCDDILEVWLEDESKPEHKEIAVAYLSSVTRDKLSFVTPPYRDQRIERPVRMRLSIFRPRDRSQSGHTEVHYVPDKAVKPPPPLLRVGNDSSNSPVVNNEVKDYHVDYALKQNRCPEASTSASLTPDTSSLPSVLSLLSQERQDRLRLESENRKLARQVHELRANLRDQVRGRENLIWLLDQKEKQCKDLESRLRETFPVQGRPRLDEISEKMANVPMGTSNDSGHILKAGESTTPNNQQMKTDPLNQNSGVSASKNSKRRKLSGESSPS